jgi:hypothetical protein
VPYSDWQGTPAETWEADGDMVRAAYTLRAEDDDFGQAGTLVREVFDDAARDRLVETVTGALSGRHGRGSCPGDLVLDVHRSEGVGSPHRGRTVNVSPDAAFLVERERGRSLSGAAPFRHARGVVRTDAAGRVVRVPSLRGVGDVPQ